MYVPPFVPQPTEIPGNVTTERYGVRLRFVRRVAALHFLSVAAVAALALLPWTPPPLSTCALGTVLVLAITSLFRTLARGAAWEHWASLSALPLLLPLVAAVAMGLLDADWPVGAVGYGLSAALIYTFACGRDLSFVGMFSLSAVASTAAIVGTGWMKGNPWGTTATAVSLNLLSLFYYVYDLGSLLSRRRLGEEAGAVVDLYRDVLNFFGYSLRSLRHWREHRIWSR
jgi:hypothetical protein